MARPHFVILLLGFEGHTDRHVIDTDSSTSHKTQGSQRVKNKKEQRLAK